MEYGGLESRDLSSFMFSEESLLAFDGAGMVSYLNRPQWSWKFWLSDGALLRSVKFLGIWLVMSASHSMK